RPITPSSSPAGKPFPRGARSPPFARGRAHVETDQNPTSSSCGPEDAGRLLGIAFGSFASRAFGGATTGRPPRGPLLLPRAVTVPLCAAVASTGGALTTGAGAVGCAAIGAAVTAGAAWLSAGAAGGGGSDRPKIA